MSASEIMRELPKLNESERRAILNKLRELAEQGEEASPCEPAAVEPGAERGRLEEDSAAYRTVDLRTRGIGKAQAADLRARMTTFAEDWERPEAAIYDEDPSR